MSELAVHLIPWVIFFGFILFSFKLVRWAKKGKRSAIAVGFVLQAFLPNIKVERRIDVLNQQEQLDKRKKTPIK